MEYLVFKPDPRLRRFLSHFWIVSGNDRTPQKVVSDGHSELIFHFGDPYQIQIIEKWEMQARSLVAGQIDKPIFLQSTGISDILGLKFTPTGLWQLFNWNMRLLTNQALPLHEFLKTQNDSLLNCISTAKTHAERIHLMENFLLSRVRMMVNRKPSIDPLIDCINKMYGQLSISSLAKKFHLSNRKLERLFNEQVGVPPKVYARMVRFKQIHKLLQQPDLNTAEATYLCGYFDQPHFNKDFKNFSGEDAQQYFRQNHHFANFFLNS